MHIIPQGRFRSKPESGIISHLGGVAERFKAEVR